MTEIFRPEDYPNHPLYNIKAVKQATGLTAATLRAWERRYGVFEPQRSESGYRLYSERDVAALRWLKRRVDEGLSISQAVAVLQMHRDSTNAAAAPMSTPQVNTELPSLSDLHRQLIKALLAFDENSADHILSEAFAMHGVEATCELVIAPAMVEIGDRWRRGEVSVVDEHFASHYVRRKLEAMVNVTPVHETAPMLVLGCAPGDWHEVALVLLAFFLRRQGYRVIYLGQNVPLENLVAELQRLRPAMVILSATTEETAEALAQVSNVVAALSTPRPLFGFGGRAFNRNVALRGQVQGHFLGVTAASAIAQVRALLTSGAL